MERHPPPPIDYQAFLESTPVVPWEFDTCSKRMSYVGPQAEAFLGYPIDDWLEPSFWTDHVLPDDQVALEAARAELIAGQGSHTVEYRMEHRDGHLVWVSEAASAVHIDGRMCCIRGLLSDVTDRRRLEASLAESEDRLRALIRGAPDAMILTEMDGAILNTNDQAMYLLGYTLEEIAGSRVDLLVPERLRTRLAEHREAFERDPERRTLVDGKSFAMQRIDGEEVQVELSVSRVSVNGACRLLYALRDLTVRLRAERQLRVSEERIRSMANALPALLSFVDTDQRYRFVNETYAAWAGWDRKDVEGRPVREILGEKVYAEALPYIEAALAGQSVHYFADVTGPGGGVTRVDVSYVPHREDGEVNGYFVVVVEAGLEGADAVDVQDFRRETVGSDQDAGDPNQPPAPSLPAP